MSVIQKEGEKCGDCHYFVVRGGNIGGLGRQGECLRDGGFSMEKWTPEQTVNHRPGITPRYQEMKKMVNGEIPNCHVVV